MLHHCLQQTKRRRDRLLPDRQHATKFLLRFLQCLLLLLARILQVREFRFEFRRGRLGFYRLAQRVQLRVGFAIETAGAAGAATAVPTRWWPETAASSLPVG